MESHSRSEITINFQKLLKKKQKITLTSPDIRYNSCGINGMTF